MQREPTARITIFASYAPEDSTLEQELKEHLRPLQREGLLELCPDRDMGAGTGWEQESSDHVNTAQIILLLISPRLSSLGLLLWQRDEAGTRTA